MALHRRIYGRGVVPKKKSQLCARPLNRKLPKYELKNSKNIREINKMKKQDLFVVSYVINIILFFATIMLMIVGMSPKIGGVILCFAMAMIMITFVIETDS